MPDAQSRKNLIEQTRAARAHRKVDLQHRSSDAPGAGKAEKVLRKREIEFRKAQEFAQIGSFTVDLSTGEQECSYAALS